jgi:hypothetical protein
MSDVAFNFREARSRSTGGSAFCVGKESCQIGESSTVDFSDGFSGLECRQAHRVALIEFCIDRLVAAFD